MKAIIIDDELPCIEGLHLLLDEYCPSIEIQQTFQQPKKALEWLINYSSDLIFLDVEMPILNGFDLLSELPELQSEVIFTTAYDSFAIQAFQVNAVDYLLKPIDPDLLIAAASRATQRLNWKQTENTSQINQPIKTLLKHLEKSRPENKVIPLPLRNGYEMAHLYDIILIMADGNYSDIYLKDGRHLVVSKSIGYLEKIIDHKDFLRTHNSYLINRHEVLRYIKSDGGFLVMSNEMQAALSKSRRKDILHHLGL